MAEGERAMDVDSGAAASLDMPGRWRDLDRLLLRGGPFTGPGFELEPRGRASPHASLPCCVSPLLLLANDLFLHAARSAWSGLQGFAVQAPWVHRSWGGSAGLSTWTQGLLALSPAPRLTLPLLPCSPCD